MWAWEAPRSVPKPVGRSEAVCCGVCWELWSSRKASASGALSAFSSTSRKPTTRRDPSRSTPRRVRLGSRQIGAFFFRHIIAARARYTDYYSLPPRPRPPPRSVASLWSNQGRVLTGVRCRTDTRRSSPESIEQANQPTEELQNRTKGTETPSGAGSGAWGIPYDTNRVCSQTSFL